jgi:hypothetical protein
MDRRQALRLLATGAALQLAPGKLFAALREARALIGTPPAARTLDSHQHATVTAIAEMILPRTETPGATDVGVSDFIDLILTEWYNDQERARFLNGLGDVDARSKTLFGNGFLNCSLDQQAEILTVLGEKMRENATGMGDQARQRRGLPPAEQEFYHMLRGLTLTAYYTSEAGATAELDFKVIPDRYDGCAELRAGKGVGTP